MYNKKIDMLVTLVAKGRVKRRQLMLREASGKYLRAAKKIA